jgi:hypothetical protein
MRVRLPQQWAVTTRVQLLQLLEYNYIILRNYSSSGRTGSTSTLQCAATTRHPAAQALPHQRRAPRLLISQSHRLYINSVVHRDYASTRLLAAATLLQLCRASRVLVSRLHMLFCAYVVHPDTTSCRSTSRRSVALALVVRPDTASRDATTHHPACTGSTAPMSCIRMRRIDARLHVSRSHWLSPCARSFRCVS